jgi:uncharacterized HAD superfamily protein
MKSPLTRIAVDIDDVLADSFSRIQEWANEKIEDELESHHYYTDDEYWEYYNKIWARHGVDHLVVFEDYMREIEVDQSKVKPHEGAKEAIQALHEKYDIVFITSRPPSMEAATRQWLDDNIDASIPLHLAVNPFSNQAAKTKGELCIQLGAGLLIDDNIKNCQSAVDSGVEAFLFGNYGWNKNASNQLVRCKDWQHVLEKMNERQERI